MTAHDVSQQRQALKKKGEAPSASSGAEEAPVKKRGRPAGQPTKKKAAAPTATANGTGPVALIDGVFTLAGQCGGMVELKRLVDRLAEARG